VKKEAAESRYKDMKTLQILEEARKGKQAEIAEEMANQKDFVRSQKIVMAMAYFENEKMEKAITKRGRLNIAKWKNADKKVFGYSIKQQNAEAYAVSIFLFAKERQQEVYKVIKSDVVYDQSLNLALANLGFRIIDTWQTAKVNPWDKNRLRDSIQMYQSGVTMYRENTLNGRVGEDWKFAEKFLNEFLAAEKPGQSPKK
jgi:hypothetical protein